MGKNRTSYEEVVLLLPTMKSRGLDNALRVFRDKGGTLRTRDLIELGVHTDALYALRESGQVIESGAVSTVWPMPRKQNILTSPLSPCARPIRLSVYQRAFLSWDHNPDSLFGSPGRASGRLPPIKLPMPVTVYRFDPKTFNEGLETHRIATMPINIYNVARTVVGLFQIQKQNGAGCSDRGTALARQRKRVQNREMLRYAKLLRVENDHHTLLQAIE